jgi:hypothetical protein
MNQITHERCSELLLGFLGGRLGEPDERDVRSHLAGCDECRAELAGLTALTADPAEPMTGSERDDLARVVRSAVTPAARPGWADRFGRRIAPALGAVAFIAIAVLGIIYLPSGGSDQEAAGGGDTADVSTEAEGGGGGVGGNGSLTQESAEDAPAPKAQAGTDGGGDTADRSIAAGQAESLEAGLMDRDAFKSESQPFAATGLDLGTLIPDHIDPDVLAYSLHSSATFADERVARLTAECSEVTIATSPHEDVVATGATYYPDDVLVITFVWFDPSARLLNYEIRGWTDGRCDRITPIYRRGVLE